MSEFCDKTKIHIKLIPIYKAGSEFTKKQTKKNYVAWLIEVLILGNKNILVPQKYISDSS